MIGRLADVGVLPCDVVEYLGCAPLGVPLFIEVRETTLALRSDEAALILVRESPQENEL
jgi:Fe2+ transport system protein FeoA